MILARIAYFCGLILAIYFVNSGHILASEEALSPGTPIGLRDGEFSITVPKGWSVFTNIPGQTLLAQAPKQMESGFRRAIQVMTLGGARFLDEVTAAEFNDIIARQYSGASTSISNYQMNNHMRVELADGRSALLFYSEFEQEQKKYMQAHILVSNLERHFLISYTDGAEHFANDATTPNLNEAWQVLMSVEVRGPTPVRYRVFFQIAGIIGLLLVSVIALGLYRRFSHKKYEQEIKSEFAEDLATAQNKLRKPVSGPHASLSDEPIDPDAKLDSQHDVGLGDLDGLDDVEHARDVPVQRKKSKNDERVG